MERYMGDNYEKVIQGNTVKHKLYIGDFAVFTKEGTSLTKEYLHHDHIGSVLAISDATGGIKELSYDAWGARRDHIDWSQDTSLNFDLLPTNKGFTGHEHMDAVGLIHMNGRVYNPELGRFLSQDVMVQSPYSTQSYNRYTYMWNNPLSGSDPSGYAAQETFTFFGNWLNSNGLFDGPIPYTDLTPYNNYYANEAYSLVAAANNTMYFAGNMLAGAAESALDDLSSVFWDKPVDTLTALGMHKHDAARTVEGAYLFFGANPSNYVGRSSVSHTKINMRSADDLMGVEPATPELISSVARKRDLVIARPGSEELRMLNYFGAEASVGGVNNRSILLRENPSKAAVLEEFLHGTQSRIGVVNRLGTSGYGSAETHVKDFMIRHKKMLGISDEDIRILQILRDKGL